METGSEEKLKHLHALHNALVAKRVNLNTIAWQTPVISLAAQAFVLTIAFDEHKSAIYRIASAIIAMLVGLTSWHAFLRHTAFEIDTSKQLEKFEITHFGETVHKKPSLSEWGCITRIRLRLIGAFSLFSISMAGLLPIADISFKFLLKILCNCPCSNS